MKPRELAFRLYADFLMPSRLKEFDRLLGEIQELGYAVWSVESYWRRARAGRLSSGRRHLVLRHDVDTDPATARRMWEIEQKRGIASSYYFRLSTVDVKLMREIHAGGGEASYHYEEIADAIKARGLARREDVVSSMAAIRPLFRDNLSALRARTGLPMRVVASHGDWANRRLQITNRELLADAALRREMNIELETYDPAFRGGFRDLIHDCPPPRYWGGVDPLRAARAGSSPLHMLVHPRHWASSLSRNLTDNWNRWREERRWRKLCASGRS